MNDATLLRVPYWAWVLLLLAVVAYCSGLSHADIPSNGDEYVYLHIARKTAESGHWLPLQSDLLHTRNTKPPLLFWQAMVSGGAAWTLAALRAPSVVYTLLTAVLVVFATRHLSRDLGRAALAGLLYLGCYSVYRYGRPLLTDSPETFWLTLIAVSLALRRPESPSPGVPALLGWGLALGVACLYKSFVLVVPVVVFYGLVASTRGAEPVWRHWVGAAWVGATGLACFALWPLLDPDPMAIVREFILGENVGKVAGGGYFSQMWLGGSSIPALFGNLLLDGGVLAPILLGIVFVGWCSRREWSSAERALWLWVLVLFVFFSIPSQRSGRYLLPALPALAVLGALRWQSIGRWWCALSAGWVLLIAAAFATLAWLATRETGSPIAVGPGFWIACGIALVCATLGLVRRAWWVLGPAGGSVILMLAMGLFLASYDRAPRPFEAGTERAVVAQTVYAPCDFAASEEAYRFMLPGADIRSYDRGWHLPVGELAAHPYFIARVGFDERIDCAGCRVFGERVVVQGRLGASEWQDIRRGHLLVHLLQRDVLVESMFAPPEGRRGPEACTPEGHDAYEMRRDRR